MERDGQLDEEGAGASRGYIQFWLDTERPPGKATQRVFSATDRILRAARVDTSFDTN